MSSEERVPPAIVSTDELIACAGDPPIEVISVRRLSEPAGGAVLGRVVVAIGPLRVEVDIAGNWNGRLWAACPHRLADPGEEGPSVPRLAFSDRRLQGRVLRAALAAFRCGARGTPR